NLDNHLADISYFWRVGFFVALDVERLLRRCAEQRATAPYQGQESANIAADACPQILIVGFKDHPLRATFDTFLDHVEQAADVDVAPGRIARQGAPTPDTDTPARERTDDVHLNRRRVEQIVFALGHLHFEAERAAHDFVG